MSWEDNGSGKRYTGLFILFPVKNLINLRPLILNQTSLNIFLEMVNTNYWMGILV